MPNICHGRGNLDRDGCCYVAGSVCPFRWKIDHGRVFDHTGTDLGNVAQAAQRLAHDQRSRARIAAAIGGRVFVCSLAAQHEGDWSAVHSDPRYVQTVRPAWSEVEDRLGMERNGYQCGTWGPDARQCCYGEDPAVNEAKAHWMTKTPVEISIGIGAEAT